MHKAEALVNTVADALKQGVAALIDFLASAIDKIAVDSEGLSSKRRKFAGRGGSDNFTFDELLELADEFKRSRGK